ncbi:MAG: hypothetical protein GX410_09665 [Elusimicrobia bacterium]|nr:hypothetical protein [Elusimicrobiota bacterium]
MKNILPLFLILAAPSCMAAGHAAPSPSQTAFLRVDANGDGRMSHAEFEKEVVRLFKLADTNKDGAVSRQEYIEFYCGKPSVGKDGPHGECVAIRAAKFDTIEARKDGKLSKTEVIAATRMDFDGSDRDGNGTLDMQEWDQLYILHKGRECVCKEGEKCSCDAAPAPVKDAGPAAKDAAKAGAGPKKKCDCKAPDCKHLTKPAEVKACSETADSCACPAPDAKTAPAGLPEVRRVPSESLR